jgi:hypothetical protein
MATGVAHPTGKPAEHRPRVLPVSHCHRASSPPNHPPLTRRPVVGTPTLDRMRWAEYTAAMKTLCRGVWLIVAAVALTGCEVPWSAPEHNPPVAVQGTPAAGVEVLLVPCSPVRITRFEVTAPREVVQRAEDPRVWQVDFSPPVTDLRRVVLGQVSPGGAEKVPWPPAGLNRQDPEFGYVVRVVLDDGNYWYQGFRRQRDLTNGRIMFHDKSVSPETFAEQSRCPQPSGQNR